MNNPFEKPGKLLKNTFIAATVAASVFSAQEARAGGMGDGNKPTIENLRSDHIEENVTGKELKSLLKGYEASGAPFEMFLDAHEGQTFMVTEAVGQTESAAKLSAEQKLRAEGKVSVKEFTKKLDNGNISVILIAINK